MSPRQNVETFNSLGNNRALWMDLGNFKVKTPFNWTCPYCGQPTSITEVNFDRGSIEIDISNSDKPEHSLIAEAISCPNPDCGEIHLRASWHKNGIEKDFFGQSSWGPVMTQNSWNLLPRSNAKPLPDYVPEEIRRNYEEACLIQNDSPKASAAMSRRCLQGIIRDFWEIPTKKRGNLGAEISFIKDEVSEDTLESINAVREVGDIGAHMEKAVDTIVDVEPFEAELLVRLIETLIDDWYVARQKRADRNSKLKEIVSQKREAKKISKKLSAESKEEKE